MSAENYCSKCGQPLRQQTTQVHIILDESGSMSGLEESTISGLREYLNTLRKSGLDYKISLTTFDNSSRVRFSNQPLEKVTFNLFEYNPGGGTALLDAVGGTVTAAEDDGKHIVVIITDGGENTSQTYNTAQIRKMIEKKQSSDRWTFVFLGANQDSWMVAQTYGLHRSNVADYNATPMGMGSVFQVLGQNTASLAASQANSTTSYFSADQQQQLQTTV